MYKWVLVNFHDICFTYKYLEICFDNSQDWIRDYFLRFVTYSTRSLTRKKSRKASSNFIPWNSRNSRKWIRFIASSARAIEKLEKLRRRHFIGHYAPSPKSAVSCFPLSQRTGQWMAREKAIRFAGRRQFSCGRACRGPIKIRNRWYLRQNFPYPPRARTVYNSICGASRNSFTAAEKFLMEGIDKTRANKISTPD